MKLSFFVQQDNDVKLSLLNQTLDEKKLLWAPQKDFAGDTDFSVEWNDGAMCFSVIGNKSSNVYACRRQKRQAERLARQLKQMKMK